jgi:ammonium transporter Rh
MDDILNATLAGGVIIGTTCELMIDPFSAILVGATGGAISTIGFAKLGPWITS